MPDRLEDLQPFVRPLIPGQPPQNPMAANLLRGLATLPTRAQQAALQAFLGEGYDPSAPLGLAMTAMGMPARGTATLGTLYLRPQGFPMRGRSPGTQSQSYNMINEQGLNKGPLRIEYSPEAKQAYVSWIGGDYATGPHTVGLSDVRSLMKAVAAEYPEAKTVGGYRVSGARGTTGQIGPAEMKLPSLTPEQVQQYQTEKSAADALYQANMWIPRSIPPPPRPPWMEQRPVGITPEQQRWSEEEAANQAILDLARALGVSSARGGR